MKPADNFFRTLISVSLKRTTIMVANNRIKKIRSSIPLPSGNRKTTRERVGGKIIRKSKAASTITALHQLLILFCKLSPHRIIENEK